MEEANCSKTETGKNNSADVDDDKSVSVQSNLRRLSGPTRRSSKANWTEEEDDILRDAVKKYEARSWKKIARCLSGRTDVQCLHRWQKVINPDLVKGPWSKEEDGILVELVGRFGEKKWSEIAEQLPGRMGKQCRERWYNHLKPEINKAAWTDEEERILINAHAQYGNKWSILAKLLPGRTENSVKNHWNCSLKKKLWNYSPNGSSANRPQPTIPPLQANNKGVAQDSTEENKYKKLEENRSSICSWKKSVDMGCTRESSVGKASDIEILNDTTKTQVQGYSSADDNDLRHNPSHGCPAPSETSSGSNMHCYTGLWYEPVEREDLNILLCRGIFGSSEKYIAPHMKEAYDSYSRARWILRRAAMSYGNMPSIIRRRTFQLLQKGASAPDNGVGASKRGDEEVVNDQLHTNLLFSHMSESFKSLHPLNL